MHVMSSLYWFDSYDFIDQLGEIQNKIRELTSSKLKKAINIKKKNYATNKND